MKQENYFDSYQELTQKELIDINGGESAWYWLVYGLASSVHDDIKVLGSRINNAEWTATHTK